MTALTPDELRIIGMAGPQFIRMLRKREENIVAKMYGEFRNGRTDFLAGMAELACVRDQIHEIETAIKGLAKEKQP